MRYLVLLLALIGAPGFAADLEAVAGDTTITLLDTPCANQIVLEILQPEKHHLYQAGRVEFFGNTYELCWRVSPDQQRVWVVDETGGGAAILIGIFAPKETI